MVKKGYKHKTASFGNDAEFYASRLFKMLRNPQGSRRPDLITTNGTFDPRLSIELKSGRGKKGVLVDYQLHYAVNTIDDYITLFGEKPSPKKRFLQGLENLWEKVTMQDNVAYYYGLLNREDKVTSRDLDRPFSTIKINWGDFWLIPHELGFYGFAISRHMRTKEPIPEIVAELKAMIKKDVEEGSGEYNKRKGHKQSWQNIHTRDIEAIFEGDLDIATKKGKQRIELMLEHYEQLPDLKKIKIPGPRRTNIYILSEPKHKTLFNTSFNEIIEERTPIINKIQKRRKQDEKLLEEITPIEDTPLIDLADIPSSNARFSFGKLSKEQLKRLQRDSHWIDKGEEPWSTLPQKPDDDIPF